MNDLIGLLGKEDVIVDCEKKINTYKENYIQQKDSLNENSIEEIKELFILDSKLRFYRLYKENIVSVPVPVTGSNKQKTKVENKNFEFKGNEKRLKMLYAALEKNDFIRLKTTKEDFINVFALDWDKHDSKIYWNCETVQIRYILDQIKPKFANMTFANIERSKKFFSKHNTHISGSNLSNAGSKNKHFDIKDKDKIDTYLEPFIN